MRMRTIVGVVLVGGMLASGGCGDDSGEPVDAGGPGPTAEDDGGTGGDGEGTIAVRLEETEGVFIEGFELGLRFSTADGEELERVLWSDFVATVEDQSLDAYYDSVFEQPVPAGTVVVEAQVTIGIGPPPEPPDLDAPELPCRLEIEVPDGGTAEVEVAFEPEGDCLREV
jgi:hypothetical protein